MAPDEADMLARARAERAAERSRPDEAAPDSADAGSPPAVTDHSEEARRRMLDAEVRRRLQEAERQAELDQISERIRQAERSRSGPGGGRHGTPPDASQSTTRATLLLVIEPGRRGIRRFNATADPILCIGDICYISRGAERDAQAMPRHHALGMINTLGRRAGACNASLECVFRNVDLGGAGVEVQPIDLRLLRHDRRRPLLARPDESCDLVDGRLVCFAPARGHTWRLWVVPEPVAREAGGPGLQAALDGGLRDGADRAAHGSRGVWARD
jgi:colicin import membrane protein